MNQHSQMLFLPFEQITISTHLNQKQVRQRLSNIIEPPTIFAAYILFGKPPTKPYEGVVSGNNFKINRNINYRNSFLPIIEGKICPKNLGCQIIIKMRLHIAVMIFMVLLLGSFMAIILLSLFAILSSNQADFTFGLVPPSICVFAYLLCMIPFNIEAKNSKIFLEKLFI